MNNGESQTLLLVSVADLKEFALTVAEQAIERRGEENDDLRLSASQVCQMYDVSQPTLWRWEKTGYLVPTRVGKRRFYSLKDVQRATGKQWTNVS